jgi:hypothetical protein
VLARSPRFHEYAVYGARAGFIGATEHICDFGEEGAMSTIQKVPNPLQKNPKRGYQDGKDAGGEGRDP